MKEHTSPEDKAKYVQQLTIIDHILMIDDVVILSDRNLSQFGIGG